MGDKDLLESVQRWNTRISHEHRLRVFNLPPFRDRRERGDLIIIYRYLLSYFLEDFYNMFKSNTNKLRGYNYKLRTESFRTTQSQSFLSIRVLEPSVC